MKGLHRAPRRRLRPATVGITVAAFALGAIGIPALHAFASTTPALVASQIATASGNVSQNNQLTLVPTMPQGCTSGDTLIAMVTIEQDSSSHVGEVPAVPAGWQRLFEHAPTDGSPYQGWFALPNCASGVNSPSFTLASPGNSLGTVGTVVMGEYSGLPSVLKVAFDVNDGWTSGTGDSLTATGSTQGEFVLTAVSFDHVANQSKPSISGDNWNSAGSTTAYMPAAVAWEISGASSPVANSSWSPSTDYEVTMIGLEAGSTSENLVQEGQAAIASGTGSVTLAQGISSHDALIAVVDTTAPALGSGYQATAITGGGVTWTPVVGAGGAGAETSEIWGGFNSSGTSGATSITASFPGGDLGEITVTEVSGISGVDVVNSRSGSSTTPSASVTPAGTNDLLVAGLASDASAPLDTHPQPDWSTLPASSAEPSFAAEWLANVAASSTTPTWDLYSSGNWVTVLAAFTLAPTLSPGTTTGLSATTATVHGFVSPIGSDTSYIFQYGTGTNPYSSATAATDIGQTGSSVPVSASLVGLAPGTTYHVQLVAWNDGGTANGPDETFTTSYAAPGATTSSTVSSLTGTTATLNGLVSPNGTDTTFVFQFGTTSSYGSNTASTDAGTGSSASSVSTNVTNLTPNTTYHFRLVATSVGGTTVGADQIFTTSMSTATTTTTPAATTTTTPAATTTTTPAATTTTTPAATTTTTPAATTTTTLPLILAKILTTRLSVQPSDALVKVRCSTACGGAIQLFEHLTLTVHENNHTVVRHESLLLGRSSFRVRTGLSATEKVKLTRTGIGALSRAKSKAFRVLVVVTVNGLATRKSVVS